MASVHHAAKASAYGKLGYRAHQMRHAARALEHKSQFGAVDGYLSYYERPVKDDDDDDDDDEHEHDEEGDDDEDVRRVMDAVRKQNGALMPASMRPHAQYAPFPVSASVMRPGSVRVSTTVMRPGSMRPAHDAPEAPALVGTPRAFVRLNEFLDSKSSKKDKKDRETIMRALRGMTELNGGRPVTIRTLLPADRVEPHVFELFPERVAEWRAFVNARGVVLPRWRARRTTTDRRAARPLHEEEELGESHEDAEELD